MRWPNSRDRRRVYSGTRHRLFHHYLTWRLRLNRWVPRDDRAAHRFRKYQRL